jgi:hypothetical protein
MDELEKTPSIGISYQIQTRQSRQLVLQSFVERDCKPEELDALLDKMRAAGDRQISWEKIDDLQLALKQEYINAQNQQVRIDTEDAAVKRDWKNRRGEVVLTDHQQKKQREAYETAEGIKSRIRDIKEALALHHARVGMYYDAAG